MTLPDTVNGCFEILGAFFVSLNVRQIWRDKQSKGIHWLAVAFFTAWGYWNLYFYPAVGQWVSFVGGVGVVVVNTIWLALLCYYARKGK